MEGFRILSGSLPRIYKVAIDCGSDLNQRSDAGAFTLQANTRGTKQGIPSSLTAYCQSPTISFSPMIANL